MKKQNVLAWIVICSTLFFKMSRQSYSIHALIKKGIYLPLC